jgi:hypothetical protein
MYSLIRENALPVEAMEQTAWSMKLTVASSDEDLAPSKVFVYQAEDPEDPDTRGWFTAVASPAMLLEYPEDTPALSGSDSLQQPYYRLDEVTLVSRSASSLEDLYEQVKEALHNLWANLLAHEELDSPVTEVIE